MIFRFVTYNILYGGKNREEAIYTVLAQTQADAIVLQEVRNPAFIHELSRRFGLEFFIAEGNLGLNLALLSRYPFKANTRHRPFGVRALLEAQIEYAPNKRLSIFAVHLVAPPIQILWELWRLWELRQILKRVAAVQPNPCILAGDFNAIAPNDVVEVRRMPLRLRLMLIYLQGGFIARQAIAAVQKAGLIDCYRLMHPADVGRTLPAFAPIVRLDYIFVNQTLRAAIQSCEVITEPSEVRRASDHLPVVVELELNM